MSRFADPLATRTVDLGACQCPGTPHEKDSAVVRFQLSASALARVGLSKVDRVAGRDPLAAYRRLAFEGLVSWNLVWLDPGWASGKGERPVVPVPVSYEAITELDTGTLSLLAETIDGLIAGEGSLPNESGAPSAESSPESASPTPISTPTPTTSSSP